MEMNCKWNIGRTQLVGLAFLFFVWEIDAVLDIDLTQLSMIIPNDMKCINGDKAMVKRINRTHRHLIVGEFESFVELDDEFSAICYGHKKAGNEYKRLPYKVGPAKFCEFFNSEKFFYPELHQVTDFPSIGTCPWPRGVYHINGYQPDMSKLPPVFASGDYMIECHLMRSGDVVQGFRLYSTVMNTVSLYKRDISMNFPKKWL